MRNILMFFLLLVFSTTGSAFLLPSIVPLVHAQSGTVIESQETDFPGVLAELIQCKRKNDVLTIKVRMKNTSSKTLRVYWPDAKKSVYLMDEANQKKYFLLKDAAGEYIYSGDPGNITADSSKISWFKFPAPPAEVEEIIIVLPGCAPFEDVPIEDK